MRPTITAELISDLKRRVIDHNEAAKLSGGPTTNLQALKKVYTEQYRGSEPAVRAMGAVDRHLGKLAKAEEFDPSKHPRNKGRFAPKGGASFADLVPADRKAHKELQQTNAGYHALTTDIVPEYRYEVAGNVARNVLSGAIGAATIYSLARGRPNGVIRRFAGGLTGNAVKYGAGVPIKSSAHILAAGLRRVSSKARKTLTPEAVNAATAKATSRMENAGRFVGHKAVDGASAVVRGTLNFAGRESPVKNLSPGQRGYNRAAAINWAKAKATQGAAFTGLSLIPAYAANQAIQGTIDPAAVGRSFDSVSYRTVEKAAASQELLAAYRAMQAEIRNASGDDLEKAAGLYSRLGRSLFGGLAAAGGAAIGSAAARRAVIRGVALAGAGAGAVAGEKAEEAVEGKKKGNPYHDAKGRFTSGGSAAAIGGGLAGAALAGGAVLYGLRRHNLRAFRAGAHDILDRMSAAIHEASSGFNGSGPHVELNAKRATLKQEAFDADKAHKAQRELLDKHGASSIVHYQDAIRADVNEKLADVLAGESKLKLPTKNDRGAQTWQTIGDLTESVPAADRGAAQRAKIIDAVDRMTPEQFDHAIEDLEPNVQARAKKWFVQRAKSLSDVESALEAHLQKVDAQDAILQAANKETHEAVAAEREANRDFLAAGPDEQEKTKAVLAAAQKRTSEARKVQGEAAIELNKLQTSGPEITAPASGKKIKPASPKQINARRQAIDDAAYARASKKADAKIEAARKEHIAKLSSQYKQELAAHSILGLQRGGIPATARKAAKAFRDARNEYLRQEAVVTKAVERDANASKALEDLKKVKAGKNLKGKTPDDIAQMKGNEKAIQDEADNAAKALTDARKELLVRETRQHQAASEFHAAMSADRDALEAPRKGRIPPWVAAALKDDVLMAADAAKGAYGRLLQAPGAKTVRDFIAEQGKRGYDAASKGLVDSYHELFTRTEQDASGKTKHVFSPEKVLRNGGAALGLVAAGKEAVDFAKAKLFGDDETAKNAKLPSKVSWESPRDPVTGVGYTAISVEDPKNPKEHILLWGQRYDGEKKPIPLYAGGSMSELRRRVAEQQKFRRDGSYGGKSAPLSQANIPNDLKSEIDGAIGKVKSANGLKTLNAGPAGDWQYRHHTAVQQQGVADKLMKTLRDQLNSGNGTDREKALNTIFSPQGRILGLRQAYELLTGYRTDGQKGKSKHGVLMQNDGFASNDQANVVEAVGEEIPKVLKLHPDDEAWKNTLHRAIAVIGAAKNLSGDSVKALHQLVSPQGETSSSEKETRQDRRAEEPPFRPQATAQARPIDEHDDLPYHWDHQQLVDRADKWADEVADGMPSVTGRYEIDRIRKTIMALAKIAHRDNPDEQLSEEEATGAAARAIHTLASGDETDMEDAKRAAIRGDTHHFRHALQDSVDEVLNYRPDYDADAELRRAVETGDLEKALEVVGLAKDAAAPLSRTLIEAGAEGGQQIANREAGSSDTAPQQSFFQGARVVHELGAAAASDVGWRIAQGIAERFLPGGGTALAISGASQAAPVGYVSRAVGAIKGSLNPHFLATNAAGLAGGLAAGAAGGAAADAISGQQYNPGQGSPVSTVGRLGGSIAGDAVGQRIGAFAAKAGANALGQTAIGQQAAGLVTRAASSGLGRTIFGQAAGRLVGRITGADLGEGAGMALGSVLGPVGAIAGGALGSWAVGEAGSRLADYFAGHDDGQVKRATARYMGPRNRFLGGDGGASAVMRQPGAGGHGGDPYHDRFGRFSSSGEGVAA